MQVTEETDDQRAKRRRQRLLFDGIADKYETTRHGYAPEVVDALFTAAELGIDDPVLEVGCGTGQLTLELARRRVALTAIDIGNTMIELASRRAGTSMSSSVPVHTRTLTVPTTPTLLSSPGPPSIGSTRTSDGRSRQRSCAPAAGSPSSGPQSATTIPLEWLTGNSGCATATTVVPRRPGLSPHCQRPSPQQAFANLQRPTGTDNRGQWPPKPLSTWSRPGQQRSASATQCALRS